MSKTYRSHDYCYSSWEDEEWKLKRDKKAFYKPSKKFKYLNKRQRKAKEKQALIHDPDNVPEFPKSDAYDWL